MATVTIDVILTENIGSQVGVRLFSSDISDDPSSQVGADIFLDEVFSGAELYRAASVTIANGTYYARIYPTSGPDTIDESGVTIGSTLLVSSGSSHVTIGRAVYDEFSLRLAAMELSVASITAQLTGGSIYAAVATPGTIRVMRGDDWYFEQSGLGDLTGVASLLMTVKRNTGDTDRQACIQWKEGTGLVVLNGTEQSGASLAGGSLTVLSPATGGVIAGALKSGVSRWLVPGEYVFDIQKTSSGVVTTLRQGSFTIDADVTHAV